MKFLIPFLLFSMLTVQPVISQEGKTINSITFSGTYTSLPWYNLKGGLEKGFVYMDNLDVSATLQFGNILDWEDNLTFYAYGIGNHGGKATQLMGDFQVASNIQAPASWKFFEVWVQKNFFDGKYSVLAGMYDLNSEFDILIPATYFINSSFGIGAEYAQSGLNGPSIFPYSSLALRFTGKIHDQLLVKLAVLDAVPGDPTDPDANPVRLSAEEGALLAGEISFYPYRGHQISQRDIERRDVTRRVKVGRKRPENNFDKINIGGWYYTSDFQVINDTARSSHGNKGIYVGAQKYLYLPNKKSGHISFFARYGIASAKFNRLSSALSGGIEITEIFGNDQAGLAFTSGFNGEPFLEVNPHLRKSETAIEFHYMYYVTSFFTVQPDIQYIIQPNSDDQIPNALSFSLLAQISVDI